MNKKIIVVFIIILIIGIIACIVINENKKKENVQIIYKITLDVNGRASVLETDEKGMLNEPDEPYMPGGKFLGWYIGDEKVDFSKPFKENTTIRAKWER